MTEPLHAPVKEVEKYLHGIQFPCSKEDLKEYARGKNAPDNVIRAIEIMYAEKFTSMGDVHGNLTSSEKRAAQRQHHAS